MMPRTTILRGLTAIPFLLLSYSLVWNSALPAAVSLAFVVFIAASALRPADCLKLLTVFVPFTIAWAVQWSRSLRWGEALTIAFLSGALLHLAFRKEASPPRVRSLDLAAAAFAALVLASWIVELVVLQHGTDYPAHFLAGVRDLFTRNFFRDPGAFGRLNEAILLLEGIALFYCTRRLATLDPSLPHAVVRMTVVAAAASATLNVVRVAEIILGHGLPGFMAVAPSLRFSVSHSDVNAAGSYFAMGLPVAIGLAAGRRKEAIWMAAALPIGAALWFAGSRVAMGAAAVGVLAFFTTCVVVLRPRRTARAVAVVGFVATIAVIAATAAHYPARRNISANTALDVRADMAHVSVELFKTRPVFGIGVGTFWTRSAEYMPARLKEFYARENAHNNFLQILAELGILGLALFVAVLVLALRPLRPLRTPDTMVVAGVLSGLMAFLLSCLGGHPLLTREVSYPFWILLGTVSVLRDDADAAAGAPRILPTTALWRRPRWWMTAGLIALALSIPFRVQRELGGRNFEDVAVGYSVWASDDQGARFRWAQAKSLFFVPRNAASVLVPLRLGGDTAGAVTVEIRLDGRVANRVTVVRDRWTMVRVVIPTARHSPRYRVVELEVEETPGAGAASPAGKDGPQGRLMVGRVSLS